MQNNIFWQKMLCYLPHGINSTSQKKTKQQNNTPNALLFCTVIAEDTAWPQKYSFPRTRSFTFTPRLGSAVTGWLHPQAVQRGRAPALRATG